jgi:hypothetical protein
VRFFVPYDARGFFDGTACAASPAYTEGARAWNTLVAQLAQARADGLTPQIVFTAGTRIGGTPAMPDPADGAQASDYSCGVEMALQALWASRQTTGMPVDLEAWNEPDMAGYKAAPWRAAMLWYLAQTDANALHQTAPGFPVVTVAALALGAPENLSYLDAGRTSLTSPQHTLYPGYYQALYEIVHCVRGYGGCRQPGANPTTMPTDWAVHDYTDPTAQGTADLREFVTALAQLNDRYAVGAAANVWVTESGVHLDAGTRQDANHPHGVTCHAATGSDDTFGCLVDGNPAAQARGAQIWRELADITAPTSHGAVRVTQLFWYQFALAAESCTSTNPCQLANGVAYTGGQSLPILHSWDSALVDSAGRPRASFCALVGQPAASCPGQSDDYADAHWVDWWEPMPEHCPAHDGAWIADRADSGVPDGQECYYSPSAQPLAATMTRRSDDAVYLAMCPGGVASSADRATSRTRCRRSG